MSERWPCPCCGYRTLEDGPGAFDVCPVCRWEDAGSQLRWPRHADGPNGISLVDAQREYRRRGVLPDVRRKARKPRSDEPLDAGWRLYDQDVDGFDDGVPTGDAPWPRDMATLYWWRATYWRGDPFTGAPSPQEGTLSHALIQRVREAAPETNQLIDTIENQYGGPAPFRTCKQLAGFVIDAYRGGRADVADRVVFVLSSALDSEGEGIEEGNAYNCVAIAFLEREEWGSEDLADHVARWPATMRRTIEDQHAHRSRAMEEAEAWVWTDPWPQIDALAAQFGAEHRGEPLAEIYPRFRQTLIEHRLALNEDVMLALVGEASQPGWRLRHPAQWFKLQRARRKRRFAG